MNQRILQLEEHRHPLAKWMISAILFLLSLATPSWAQNGTWRLIDDWPNEYVYMGSNVAFSWPYLVTMDRWSVPGVYRLEDDEWIIDSHMHFLGGSVTMVSLDGDKVAFAGIWDSLIDIGVHGEPNWEREFTIDVGARYNVVDISLSGDVLAAAIHDRDADLHAVLVFRFDGLWWDLEQQIPISAAKVAVDDDHLLMDDLDTGSAVIFRRGAQEWEYVTGLWNNVESPVTSLDLNGGVAAVGRAAFQYSAGVVDLYRQEEENVWLSETIEFQSDPVRGSLFGWSLDLDGDLLLVGAVQDGDDLWRPGATWLFEYNAAFDRWTENAHFSTPYPTESEHDFGHTVGISGGYAAVGAPWENVDDKQRAGAVWVFDLDPYRFVRLSEPYPGYAGVYNSIGVERATPGEPVYFIYGFEPGSTEIPRCPGVFVEIQEPQLIDVAYANVDGYATIDMLVPENARGLTVLLQAVDWAACQTSNLVEHTFE